MYLRRNDFAHGSLPKVLIVAVGATLVSLALIVATKSPEVFFVKCRELNNEELGQAQARLDALPLYVADSLERATVRFQFNLDADAVGESLFVIYSYHARSAVYRGPYHGSVQVAIDGRLAKDRYFDDLQFKLLRIAHKQICTWINDSGAPYWRPNATIDIEFLEERTVDENGLPKSFNVSIR